MEKVLQQILNKLDNLASEIGEIKPKVEESHQWLGALYKASEFHKADIDQLQHKVAKLEGSLKGSAKQLLDDLNELKEVSNQ